VSATGTPKASADASIGEVDMNIKGSVAFVTGANRGLGAAYARALLERGAAKVYAAVRRPETITDPRLVTVRLDLTDRASIAEAAGIASDATLVINNAGISTSTPILGDEDRLRQELEVNYLGPIALSRSFAPVLGANGGGALVNVLSVLSWLSLPTSGGYSAAKAAMWNATNALRLALADQHTLVVAVHVAYMDTDMAAKLTVPKTSPDAVADATLDAVQTGQREVLADDTTRHVRAALSGPLTALYPALAHPTAA
jgi:NAD(P)-dependent dehydrogenase (short-subunit alcohol dehydrogenase family)